MKITEEHKAKIVGNLQRGGPKTEAHKQSIRESLKRKWEDPEFRAIQLSKRKRRSGGRKRGYHHTPETKAKLSEHMTSLHIEGKLDSSHLRSKWVEQFGVKFRSTYEARCAEILEENAISWVYEPRRFRLKNTTYMPDFFLPEFGVYLEVKGPYRPAGWDAKILEFRERFCLVLVSREDLFV